MMHQVRTKSSSMLGQGYMHAQWRQSLQITSVFSSECCSDDHCILHTVVDHSAWSSSVSSGPSKLCGSKHLAQSIKACCMSGRSFCNPVSVSSCACKHEIGIIPASMSIA